jgi:sugar phosphate isomerase/epimerase
VKNYVDFLHASRVVDGISSIYISVDNVLETMFGYNVPQDKIFERTVEHGKETAEVLAEAGSKALIISPSPKIATMRSTYSDMSEEDRVSWFMDNIAVAINDVAAFAKSMGVDTYIRNDFWGYARGNNVIGLMDRLDSGIGFSPDLAQLEIAGVSAEELIDKYAGRVGYFKACDTFYKDELGYFEKHNPEYPAEGNNQRVYCDLGNGNVNVPSAYKAFAKAGGDWVVLDSRDSFNYVKALVKMQVYANKHFED